jgi:hypothetical protein
MEFGSTKSVGSMQLAVPLPLKSGTTDHYDFGYFWAVTKRNPPAQLADYEVNAIVVI